MLAIGDGFQDQFFGDTIAADQFDHDIDIGMVDDQVGIVDDFTFAIGQGLGTRNIEVGDHGDFNPAASAAGNFFLIALEDVECAGADGADA